MAFSLSANRIAAVVVLLGAAAWVITGEFSAVGSQEAEAAQKAPDAAAEGAAPALRTVAAIVPVFADYSRQIRISGATEADKVAVLAARADGIVQSLEVKQGQQIAANDVVARLEGTDVEAAVRNGEVALARAEQELKVGEELYARGSLPELDLGTRRTAKAAAEAALSAAQADYGRLTVLAPFSGTIDKVDIELGEWAQVGTPIATLLSLDPIVIRAGVSEADVALVSKGSPASVRLLDGAEVQGTVRHVAKQASDKTRTFEIEVALPNSDGAIPAGMTAEVRLSGPPQRAITVPRSVLTLNDEGQIGLRVVGADNVARFVAVSIIEDGEKGLVIAGVPDGVRVVVAGQDLIRDGDKVNVSEIDITKAAEGLE